MHTSLALLGDGSALTLAGLLEEADGSFFTGLVVLLTLGLSDLALLAAGFFAVFVPLLALFSAISVTSLGVNCSTWSTLDVPTRV